MYCEHFLPAVYWSLMTWAARWSNVLRNYCYLPLALPPEVLQFFATFGGVIFSPLSSFNFVDALRRLFPDGSTFWAGRFMTPLVKPSSVHWGYRRINVWRCWYQFESVIWRGEDGYGQMMSNLCCVVCYVCYIFSQIPRGELTRTHHDADALQGQHNQFHCTLAVTQGHQSVWTGWQLDRLLMHG